MRFVSQRLPGGGARAWGAQFTAAPTRAGISARAYGCGKKCGAGVRSRTATVDAMIAPIKTAGTGCPPGGEKSPAAKSPKNNLATTAMDGAKNQPSTCTRVLYDSNGSADNRIKNPAYPM